LLAQMDLSGGELAVDGDSLQPGARGTATFTVTAKYADVEGAILRVSVDGDTAEHVSVDAEFAIGRIAAGEQKTIEIPIEIAAEYPCGTSTVLSLALEADNAATQREELNLFFPATARCTLRSSPTRRTPGASTPTARTARRRVVRVRSRSPTTSR